MENKAFWLVTAFAAVVIIEEARIAHNIREFHARQHDQNIRIAKLSEMLEAYKAAK